MSNEIDRRRFVGIVVEMPCEIRQGSSVWHRTLVNLSLAGVGVDEPPNFDAQYNEPFTIVLDLDSGPVELHAYLLHTGRSQLGFSIDHLDADTLAAVRSIMEAELDNPAVLNDELQALMLH
jgi:hypothetical protein